MEKNQILLKEKLGVLGILKESFKIPCKSPKFIFLTFLTSLPLFVIMLLHEIILQTSMLETKSFITSPANYYDLFYSSYSTNFYIGSLNMEYGTVLMLFQRISAKIFQLGFLYFVPLHLLDLLNTIVTVVSASTIYGENPIGVREMLLVPIKKIRLTGPLITSMYVLLLNCFVLFGLSWIVTNSIIPAMGNFFTIVYAMGSIILAVKWIEWTSVWNMSIVFSILDERHGLHALALSGYFSKGNRRRGLQLMSLFFVWRIVLRLSCLYVGGHEKWVALVATSFFSCVGNVMKWVVCTVYFYDCKTRILAKKVDVEKDGNTKNDNIGLKESSNV